MNDTASLLSKVLVLDGSAEYHERIKAFCDRHRLVPLKAHRDNVMDVLRSNVDLGAVLLSEHHGAGSGSNGVQLAGAIHRVRPELPMFLRRDRAASLAQPLSEAEKRCFRAVYTIDEIDALSPVIEECIFARAYPAALVRGITDITRLSLENQFRGVVVDHEAPYLVRDRIIYGELFSLIPLESHWCRGYMMLQAEEHPVIDCIRRGKTLLDPDCTSFRDLNNILGELTNLIWGGFKNRFVSHDPAGGSHLTQVPIIVNHPHNYISFGSEDPQLCIKYTLTDPNGDHGCVVIQQRFVFNLNWSPDAFSENEASVDSLVESGELEMF